MCCSLSTSVCPPPQNGEFVLFVGGVGGGAEKDVQRLHVMLFKRFS